MSFVFSTPSTFKRKLGTIDSTLSGGKAGCIVLVN